MKPPTHNKTQLHDKLTSLVLDTTGRERAAFQAYTVAKMHLNTYRYQMCDIMHANAQLFIRVFVFTWRILGTGCCCLATVFFEMYGLSVDGDNGYLTDI